MAYGPYTLTGEGHVAFGTSGLVLVTDIDVQVTTWTPKQRVVGAAHPYGLWHVGWVGVGWSPDDATGIDYSEIYEGFFIESEYQDKYLTNKRVDVFVGTLFYKLTVGVEIVVNIGNL